MAIAFVNSSGWAGSPTGLTADYTQLLTNEPSEGAMMVVVAAWKDYSITAQVTTPAGWTELVEIADGAVSTGNGTGSMKVGAWYKVHGAGSGETGPTIDFSTTTGLLAQTNAYYFSKGVGETWDTPTYVQGAINTWGTGGGTTTASSTITVPNGAAVIGIAAIRDDSTITARSLDDSGAAITWNGAVAVQPSSNASTTTGNDMSMSMVYRLVTTGASGVTLRQGGTLSATETGNAVWIILSLATPTDKYAGLMGPRSTIQAVKRASVY